MTEMGVFQRPPAASPAGFGHIKIMSVLTFMKKNAKIMEIILATHYGPMNLTAERVARYNSEVLSIYEQ